MVKGEMVDFLLSLPNQSINNNNNKSKDLMWESMGFAMWHFIIVVLHLAFYIKGTFGILNEDYDKNCNFYY